MSKYATTENGDHYIICRNCKQLFVVDDSSFFEMSNVMVHRNKTVVKCCEDPQINWCKEIEKPYCEEINITSYLVEGRVLDLTSLKNDTYKVMRKLDDRTFVSLYAGKSMYNHYPERLYAPGEITYQPIGYQGLYVTQGPLEEVIEYAKSAVGQSNYPGKVVIHRCIALGDKESEYFCQPNCNTIRCEAILICEEVWAEETTETEKWVDVTEECTPRVMIVNRRAGDEYSGKAMLLHLYHGDNQIGHFGYKSSQTCLEEGQNEETRVVGYHPAYRIKPGTIAANGAQWFTVLLNKNHKEVGI